MLSPPPDETKAPSGMPYKVAAGFETLPATASGSINGGNQASSSGEMSLHICVAHLRCRTSKTAIPEASPYSAE
jgi:hypothetical protein